MRKIFYLTLSLLCLLSLLSPSISNAHPGRTDSNGGHTCHTNCEKWGLESGEYHYHNDGGGSKSNSETNSNSNSGSESKSKSNSNSSNNSGSESGSKSNSSSDNSSNSKADSIENKSSTEKSKPKIDKKQVQADEHYQKAVNYFDNKKYKKAVGELDNIYDLDRNDAKTDKLMQRSLTSIYELAETKLDNGEYKKAEELLGFILDFPHSNTHIIEKSEELLKNVILLEQISSLLFEAHTAKDNKEYEEALSLITEARDLKEIDEISDVFNLIIDDILYEAKSTYSKNEFKKSSNLYALLEKQVKSSKLKDNYQAMIQHTEDLQIIKEKYKLDTFDFNQDSLFNHLLDDNETLENYSDVVKPIRAYIGQNEQNKVHFIFDINISDLAAGGQ